MADDLGKIIKDRKTININQQHELNYWTKAFGVSEQELIDAVNAVGISSKDVRDYFGV